MQVAVAEIACDTAANNVLYCAKTSASDRGVARRQNEISPGAYSRW